MFDDMLETLPRMRKPLFLKVANHIMDQSLKEVPIDTATLQDSNYIEDVTTDVAKPVIRFGYGGPNDKFNTLSTSEAFASEYALIQHEDLDFIHASGRKAKYLEDPINASVPYYEREVKRAYSEWMNGVGIKWRGRGKRPGGKRFK